MKDSMNIKRYLLAGLLCIATLSHAQSKSNDRENQHTPPSREKIQQEKKDFLKKKLQLTDKESDDLMVILNELDIQRFKLWQQTRELGRRIHQGDHSISDEEYNKHFTKVLDNKVEEAQLERTYYLKCKEVLPMSKLVKLDRVNREFVHLFLRKRPR